MIRTCRSWYASQTAVPCHIIRLEKVTRLQAWDMHVITCIAAVERVQDYRWESMIGVSSSLWSCDLNHADILKHSECCDSHPAGRAAPVHAWPQSSLSWLLTLATLCTSHRLQAHTDLCVCAPKCIECMSPTYGLRAKNSFLHDSMCATPYLACT